MILTLICIGLVFWLFYTAIKFYRSADWDEPAESSPDFGDMRKKEAQILLVQDILEEAADQGKLAKSAVDEFSRYAEAELGAMKDVKKAWEERKRQKPG